MINKMRERRETLEAYRKVFNSHEGRLILKDLMKSCSFYDSVFNTDLNTMAFDEGQRALVLRIINTIKLTPSQIDQMFDAEIFEE